ncbi:MAG: hypothetical protein GTN93_19880 [Anaerolineae bacterium]|nr:hypothetical protein [Anaerolineae bacterium]NIQ80303.1 hypothetical protein [Anaerolineae bacterium]
MSRGYDFEDMKQRCHAFWHMEPTDRPLIAMYVGNWVPGLSYPSGTARMPEDVITPESVPIKEFLADYERLYQVHLDAGGDIPWVAVPYWGIPWLEAILGCQIQHSAGTAWSEPWMKGYEALDTLSVSADNAWLKKLLEFTEALVDLSNRRFPVGQTLMRGISDLVAALRGHTQSILDLYDHPEELDVLIERLTSIWMQVARAHMELIPPFQGGSVLGVVWPVWAPDTAGWTQEDAAALWSPTFFRQYLLPKVRELTSMFEFGGVHLHSPFLYPVEQYLTVDSVRVIEINKDVRGPTLPELAPTIREIQEAGKPVLVWGEFDDADLEFVCQELDPRGLCLQMIARSVEHAHHILGRLGA